jgi:hypothetical protein
MGDEGSMRGYEGPADRARRKVLEQHRELRRLLLLGVAQVGEWTQEHNAPHEPLRSVIDVVRDVFIRHLADEEALILPILDLDVPLGPQRAAALHEEHDRQRAELQELAAWPEDGDDDELALRFKQLAKELLADIAHEEADLLAPSVIRDDQIVVDQSGG